MHLNFLIPANWMKYYEFIRKLHFANASSEMNKCFSIHFIFLFTFRMNSFAVWRSNNMYRVPCVKGVFIESHRCWSECKLRSEMSKHKYIYCQYEMRYFSRMATGYWLLPNDLIFLISSSNLQQINIRAIRIGFVFGNDWQQTFKWCHTFHITNKRGTQNLIFQYRCQRESN